MDSLALLPEEMWKRALDYLTSHKDLHPSLNTCQLWRSLISKKQTEWMFQGVLPSLVHYLPKSDILNCRRVSKSWNKTVDAYLENSQPSFNIPGGHNGLEWPRTLRVNLNESAVHNKISTTEAIKMFQAEFKASENPFVSRSLEQKIGELNLTTLELFENFGVHLHCLDFSIFLKDSTEITPPVEIVKFVWNVLGFVPNLKKLILDIIKVNNFREIRGEEEKAQKLDIAIFLKSNLVPALPQLRNLELNGNVRTINQILKTRYGPQLRAYSLISPFEVTQLNMPNLTELACDVNNIDCNDMFNQLKNLGCLCLKRLKVQVRKTEWSERANFEDKVVVKAIEYFSKSLTHLYVHWIATSPSLPALWKLPLVEELTIDLEYCQNPMDIKLCFLQNLTSLRKMTFTISKFRYNLAFKTRKDDKYKYHPFEEELDFHYYLTNEMLGRKHIYKSNIWRLLLSLDMIQINSKLFSSLGPVPKIYTRYEMNKEYLV